MNCWNNEQLIQRVNAGSSKRAKEQVDGRLHRDAVHTIM